MIKDKSFYAAFFKMALVLILQQVITLSVNLADNIMIGASSEDIRLRGETEFTGQRLLIRRRRFFPKVELLETGII